MTTQGLVEPSELQRQARALGDPTRHTMFQRLLAAEAPMTVAELTAELGLNHNAIRQHLATLCQAELVVEDLAPPAGPGRRRLLYRVAPAAATAWGSQNPYQQLTLLLLDMIRTGRPAAEVGRDAGRRLARRRRPDGDGTDAFVRLVAGQGFDPRVVPADHGAVVVLARCPFADAATADPTTVCELHRGLAEGMAETLGDGAVTGFVARNPKRAGCRINLTTKESADV